MFKTPADYLDLFLIQGVLFSNDIIIPNGVLNKQGKNCPDQEVAKKIKDYSEFLIDLLFSFLSMDSSFISIFLTLDFRVSVITSMGDC